MVKAISFYLPQYHPVKENEEWWGPGFTEWRNVAKAVPNFEGHYQPHQPGELGFYDLRLVEVQKRQAELAREYGLHGFCYYYYWFNGRRILERPLQQVLEHKEIDFPFCVCWANENWTRAWNGAAHDVLLAQNHTPEDDEAFLRSLLPLFQDSRYIRVDGKPMLLVYRLNLFPDAKATAERWRRIAKEAGLPGLHLCAVQFYGVDDPREWGFDAAVEFPPHKFLTPENRPDVMPSFTNPRFSGGVIDYQKVITQALQKELPEDYVVYRGVMASWDNTARRQDTPHIFINSSPLDYQYWLRRVVEQTRQTRPPEHQIVFINAWNEWGEGCHLEPDLRYGRAWLEATHSAVSGFGAVDDLMARLGPLKNGQNEAARELKEAFDARERSLYALQQVIRRKNVELEEQARRFEELLEKPEHRVLIRARETLSEHPKLKGAVRRIFGPLLRRPNP